MQQMAEPCEISEIQFSCFSCLQSLFDHLLDFHRVPVALGDIGSRATLGTLLERCDIGERCGEKRYKAEDLDASRVQLPVEVGIVDVEDVLFSRKAG